MKFKDILMMTFLTGLLVYAFCLRAGFFGNWPESVNVSVTEPEITHSVDSLIFEDWIFASDPDSGLTILTLTGETLHRMPEFRSGLAEIVSEPDTSGNTRGLVVVKSESGMAIPCFRILTDGALEYTSI